MAVLGWSVQQATGQTADELNNEVKTGQYVSKIDSLLVIIDASDTMNGLYKGKSKWNQAQDVLKLMNRTIPDIPITAALRKYADLGNYNDLNPTERLYGPARYSRPGFEEGLTKTKVAAGGSPLAMAINAASEDLGAVQGKIAVIIVSDGAFIPHAPAVQSAEALKKQFGDRLCIYTVLVGDNPEGSDLLKKIAAAGQCGLHTSADSIVSEAGMVEFVKTVFLSERPDSDGDGVPDDVDQCPNTPKGVKVDAAGCPLDSDGDGVPDYLDQCPGTPKGAAVDKKGCLLDSDGDGVPNSLDKCPNTPKGARVDERGCWAFLGTFLFGLNKSDLKPEVLPALNNAVNILRENPDLKVEIQGYTCNLGSAAYNQKLSEKRALSVYHYLVDRGIAKRRLSVKGYGLLNPAYSNDTEEGRAKNRRVEFSVSHQ
jgi:OOP family OmpA-OmpF porin